MMRRREIGQGKFFYDVIVQKAEDLVQQGMRITIVRTVTGDPITVPELKQGFADHERT